MISVIMSVLTLGLTAAVGVPVETPLGLPSQPSLYEPGVPKLSAKDVDASHQADWASLAVAKKLSTSSCFDVPRVKTQLRSYSTRSISPPSGKERMISSSPPWSRPRNFSDSTSVVVTPICQSTSASEKMSMSASKFFARFSCSSTIEQELSMTTNRSTALMRLC